MDKYNIPQPCFFECKNEEEVISVATKLGFPIVLKADGLAAGKGVIICYNQRDLDEALDIMFKDRKFGSAALDMAYVACGRYDGFFQEKLNLWDIAPGIILIEEAGGIINKADTKKINDIEVITSNPSINEKMLNILDKF